MTLQIFDTATGSQRPFEPLREGHVGIYICGLTTQGAPHIGHVRFAVAFDILRRWLTTGHGYDVTLVRNVTDIDDKILAKSAEADVPWNQWSYNFERATNDALDLLGVLRPSYEPRATGHITDMVDLVRMLIDKGHAYPAEDGSGDVYFDVKSWPEYGQLTRQRIDDMEPAADADPRGKRDPRDFALWKGSKSGEPANASWPTPWGDGRPGWHLECSAMVRRWLGDTFDIHGGGIDLRFPHHENEQAQSRGAGLGFARYWMHNGWVTISGEKMSKSLGNSLAVLELTKTVRPLVLRYYLGAVHYRSTIEYQPGSLDEAAAAVERIEGFLDRALPSGLAESGAIPTAFAEAMDDDLNVSGALAVVFDHIRQGNIALDDGDTGKAAEIAGQVVAMTEVLGVNPLAKQWNSSGDGATTAALGSLVESLIDARARARKDRDFTTADQIRDQLTAAGIAVEDSPDGARWTVTGKPTKDD
ncbi:cysteine--tRNA ligase [Flexivirga endophytica]|uniref:Cysteine--tRNA ligase n=1 Tax=Flexivirga endophytica TaxID=1849103 RepID=A0A916TH94_9MICO|nr:cysteine--tRNA ligase [Flexivirga endophytica]GGB43698.1 cysteine--tRNA ligase [Flexivirga endophytica]GHB68161.1 cysteine--tRNA ligase [Flexivirga endophytica]